MPKAKLAAAASSPFLQLLTYLQSNPSITDLEHWLTTNFAGASGVVSTVASIITQALTPPNDGTITFSTPPTPQPTLEPLCAAFGFTAPTLPTALAGNISLGITSFAIDVTNPALQITGTCTGVLPASAPCNFFVSATDDLDNGWALVFGGDLQARFSNFPIIGSADLSVPLDLAAAFLVVSTGGITNYTVPDSANSFANSPISFSGGGGVMIAAMLDLSNVSSGTCGGNLAYCNNPPQTQEAQPQSENILITADLNATEATLTAALGSRTLYNWSNNSAQAAVTLDLTLSLIFAGSVTIQLTSSLTVRNMTFGVSIDLSEETLLFDLSLTSSGGIQLELPDYQYFPSNVYINSIQGLLGIDFEKCEAEVGIAAAFSFGAPPSSTSSTDLVTSLLPTNNNPVSGNVPAPSAWECALIVGLDPETLIDIDLVLLSIDQVSLFDICGLLLPPNTLPSDIAQVLNGISLNNILFYWCDDLPGNFAALNLSLPGYGTDLPTGLIFQGGLTWGSFSAFAGITVDSSGCSGSFSVSPFSIGSILSISGGGTGWTGPNGQTIGANGPEVEFNTTGSPNPYIYANWAVTLLDLGSVSALVTVTSTELDFSIDAQIGSMADASFDCQLDPAQGWFSFQCSGTFDDSNSGYGVGINTGPYNETIQLSGLDFSASFSVTVNGSDVSWTVEGTLKYYGLSLSIPSFTGDFLLGTVEDVLKAVWRAILASVDSVFSNILNEIRNLGKDFVHFVDKVVDDVKAFFNWVTGGKNLPSWSNPGSYLESAGGVYFEVVDDNGIKLQFVPASTFPVVNPNNHNVFQNMDPVIAAQPQDVMLPDVTNGTVFQRRDDGQWFVVAWNYKSGNSGTEVAAVYPIQNFSNPGGFQQRCTGPVEVAWQVNPYGGGNQSADEQIHQAVTTNGTLNGFKNGIGAIASDATSGPNYGSISLFIDGIRYHIGPNLWYPLGVNGHFETPSTIPDAAYSGLPQYQGLGSNDYTIDVQQGNLYKSDAQQAIYYASMGSDGLTTGLYYIDYNQWVSIWKAAAPILIPDAFWELLQISQNNAYPGPSANNNYSGTNPPAAPVQLTWVHNGTGNGAWPSGTGYTAEYGVSFVDAEGNESNVTWGPQLLGVGSYMCAELAIPTDTSNPPVAVARKIYRQFLLNGLLLPNSAVTLVGTVNDNYTTVWQDTNAAYNIAAPAEPLGPPDSWQGSAPVANSPVWQTGNQVQYAVTYVLNNMAGETQLSQWSDAITVGSSADPAFNNIPTCPTDDLDSNLLPITRNIYRICTDSNGDQIDPPITGQRLVGQISDNVATVFRDSLPTPAPPPQGIPDGAVYNLGTGGNGVWPAGKQGNSVYYGVSFVNGAMESTITWGAQTPITGYMGFELNIPTDNSSWATARNMYRQFFGSNGSSLGPPELVGTVNDNRTTGWNDVSPAYNVAAPPQLKPPNNQYWGADAPIANSQVWQVGNNVQYAVTYVLPGGETQLSEWSAPIPVNPYAYPYFDSVPTCPMDPTGSGTILDGSQTVTRNIYRMCTGPGGNVIEPPTLLLPVSGSTTTIPDNSTTIFHDWTS
jgi:hypothetical protein